MIILGVVLAVVGWLIGLGVLVTIGIVLLVVGLVLLLLGQFHGPVGGRRYWWLGQAGDDEDDGRGEDDGDDGPHVPGAFGWVHVR